jgi:hypothetical protein
MDANSADGRRVFVVLSRTETKIWKGDFESGAVPIAITEAHVDREYKKMINQYFSGRRRSKLDPEFVGKVVHELMGFERIYLAGGGKGKASAIQNLNTYLKEHFPAIAKNVRAIKVIDASNMSDKELLVVAREMVAHDI